MVGADDDSDDDDGDDERMKGQCRDSFIDLWFQLWVLDIISMV